MCSAVADLGADAKKVKKHVVKLERVVEVRMMHPLTLLQQVVSECV